VGIRDLSLDGGDQPRQSALEQVVVGAHLDRLDGGFVADGSRNEQEGDVTTVGAEGGDRLLQARTRQVEVADHEVPLATLQLVAHRCRRQHPGDLDVVSATADLALDQDGVVFFVLDQQQPKDPEPRRDLGGSHHRSSVPPA